MLVWLVFIGLLLFTFYAMFVLAYWSINFVVSNFQNGRSISFTNPFNIIKLDLLNETATHINNDVLHDNDL